MTDTHIKINAVTPRVQYTGNGSTTVFPYEFPIFDESDMVVYFGDEIQESGYTVSGAGQTEGGNVTFDAAPDDGVVITLYRNIPIERVTDFQEGGTFRPKNLNDEFDRQTAFLQQVNEALGRAVKVDVTSDTNPEDVIPKVEAIYDDIDNLDAVAAIATDITTVSNISSNITAVANNETNINAVNSNKTNIDAVAGNATNINAVNSNKTNIDTVATNISDVNTCAENISDIADKANKTMNNLTATGESFVANLAMPSDTFENITADASGSTYTAPGNGYLYMNIKSSGSGNTASLINNGTNEANICSCSVFSTASNQELSVFMPAKTGDVIKYYYNGTVQRFRFTYAKGDV